MQKSIVSRDDRLSRSMPDLVSGSDASLVCVFRESSVYPRREPMEHLPGRPFSRICQVCSFDEGNTWDEVKQILAHTKEEGLLNCPRLLRLRTGELLLAVDWIPENTQGETSMECRIWLWRSSDQGRSWRGPEKTSILGIVPSLKQLRNGTILCGTSIWNAQKEEAMTVHLSADEGKTWTGPITVAEKAGHSFCEADFVELDTGRIVSYLREEKHPPNSFKALSDDGGKTWQGPYRAGLLSCLGRPSAKLLRTGEVVVTYRCDYSGMFCLYTENQDQAGTPTPEHERVFGRNLMLDIDRGPINHYGYSGWTELPDGDIFVVQHIIDDALPGIRHIRGYRVARSDWTLSPKPNEDLKLPAQETGAT
jgi:hypothetical protein